MTNNTEYKVNMLIDIVERLVCVTSGINPKDAQNLLEQLYELSEAQHE